MSLKSKLSQALFALASFAVLVWDVPWIKRGFGALTGIDFIYEKAKDPGWLGNAFHMALNPPPGTALLVAIVGLVLIYWTTKPRETRMSAPVIGMLICLIGFAGFGVWYLVKHQTEGDTNASHSDRGSERIPFRKKLASEDFEQRRILLNALFKFANGEVRNTYDVAWGLYNDQPRLINTNQKAVFHALEQVRSGLISASADLKPLIRDSENYADIRNLDWNFEHPLLGTLNEMISRLNVSVQNGVVVHVDSKETDELKAGISALGKWIETTKNVIQAKKAEDDVAEIIGTKEASGAKTNSSGASFLILEPPPELEGSPLGWQKSPYLGWQKQTDGSIQARTIAIHGKNVGKEEVQLTDPYIVSGITGRRLNLNIFGRNPDGTGSMTLPKDTYPIPPDANMQLSTEELNGTAGVQENDFLKEWGTIYFTTEYNGEKHRFTYDRKTMEALFEKEKPKPPDPHVARRQ